MQRGRRGLECRVYSAGSDALSFYRTLCPTVVIVSDMPLLATLSAVSDVTVPARVYSHLTSLLFFYPSWARVEQASLCSRIPLNRI